MRNKKLTYLLLGFLMIILIGTGATIGYAAYLTDKAQETASESLENLERGEKSERRKQLVRPEFDNTSVLFIGIDDSTARADSENETPSRSDALVLATFNDDDKSIKLLSIPRDSYTYIPEVGYKDKITHAHAFGGTDATVKAVENLMDIPVDYYVRLNFNSFVEVVNSLDGVHFDVPFDMKEQNSDDQDNSILLDKGYQTINGEEALALVRSRHYDSDLARGQRQMEMIQAIISEAKTISSIKNYGTLIDSIGDHLKTNLTFDQMLAYKDYLLDKNNLDFDEMQLEGKGGYIDGVWYYQVDDDSLNTIQSSLRTHLGLSDNSSGSFASEPENDTTTH